MTEREVTLEDCAACGAIQCCNAHITGGTWPHAKGPIPCIVSLNEQNQECGGNGIKSNKKE